MFDLCWTVYFFPLFTLLFGFIMRIIMLAWWLKYILPSSVFQHLPEITKWNDRPKVLIIKSQRPSIYKKTGFKLLIWMQLACTTAFQDFTENQTFNKKEHSILALPARIYFMDTCNTHLISKKPTWNSNWTWQSSFSEKDSWK